MKHLDLCSGIAGFAVAIAWCGYRTIGFSEIDEFANKILKQDWPEVPNYGDIKNVPSIECDIITAGYPCQPFSVGGSQKAEKDDRHLWPEVLKVIQKCRPTWVFCENVYGHVKLGLDDVLDDLENNNYTTQPFIIPSLSKGADHNRRRVFIVAHTTSNGRNGSKKSRSNGKTNDNSPKRPEENSDNERRSRIRAAVERFGSPAGTRGVKPPTLRVADGLPDRAHRNKAIGNAVDPRIAYEIIKHFEI